jgi:hypothetical protein
MVRQFKHGVKMDNQHKKIKGYRDLSQAEIDLMNAIKTKGAELLALHAQVASMVGKEYNEQIDVSYKATPPGANPVDHYTPRLQEMVASEPVRWAAIAKTDIQTGLMALIRSVAQPTI